MLKRPSVRWLVVRQYASRFLPWVVVALALASLAFGIAYVSGTWWHGIAALLCGGTAYGYMAWGVSNDWHGLVRAPKTPWVVSVQSDAIRIDMPGSRIEVPLNMISKARLVQDMGWEKMRGVEDSALVLFLKPRFRLCIPGSSPGFNEVLEYVRRHTAYERKEL